MAFYLLGECCAWLMNGFVPGSVLGMMFLFLALSMHWVRPERVRPVARFLCDNMAFFFLPAEWDYHVYGCVDPLLGHRVGGGDGDDFVGFDRGGGFATMARGSSGAW